MIVVTPEVLHLSGSKNADQLEVAFGPVVTLHQGCAAVRDMAAEPHAVVLEALCHFQRPRAHVPVIRAMDRAFDGARHHLAGAVLERRMVDVAVAQKRPVLP